MNTSTNLCFHAIIVISSVEFFNQIKPGKTIKMILPTQPENRL